MRAEALDQKAIENQLLRALRSLGREPDVLRVVKKAGITVGTSIGERKVKAAFRSLELEGKIRAGRRGGVVLVDHAEHGEPRREEDAASLVG